MISIRKAASELDRIEKLLASAMAAYTEAIRATAQYAVGIEAAETNEFRDHLHRLEAKAEAAGGPQDWEALRTAFRGELREHRDRVASQIEGLRERIRAADEAVRLFAENATSIDSDHETQIQEALTQLDWVAKSSDPEVLRSGITSSAHMISESIEQMRRRHHGAVTELRDEIRLLHKQIEAERKAQSVDAATGAWTQAKLDTQIVHLLEQNLPFCVLIVCIRNLAWLETRYSKNIVEAALKTLLQRFAHLLGKDAAIGRWNGRTFAAILEMEPGAALAVWRLATSKLAGDYTIQENGLSHSVPLEAVAGVIDRADGCDEPSFRKKLLQMSQALAGA